MDNSYYAIKTLNILMKNWKMRLGERGELIEFILKLQTSSGGFKNDRDSGSNFLRINDPNLFASYFCLKSLEAFNMLDTINMPAFHLYLDDLFHSDRSYFDIEKNYVIPNYTNIVATAIGLELIGLTGYAGIDQKEVLGFILRHRNNLGGWDGSTTAKIHELIDTFQIILLELFIDLAALSIFVIEPSESDVMANPPRNPNKKFMDVKLIKSIIIGGISLMSGVLLVYLIAYMLALENALTMAFATWMICHIFLAYNMRTENDPLYKIGFMSNKMMHLWAVLVVFALILIIYIPPLQLIFSTYPLTGSDWLIIIGVSTLTTFWIELKKIVKIKSKI